jgi:hypothetical protein
VHMGGLGWPAGSVAQRVSEHRWRRFSGARSHVTGIWPVGGCWASAAGRTRAQGGGQAGSAIEF